MLLSFGGGVYNGHWSGLLHLLGMIALGISIWACGQESSIIFYVMEAILIGILVGQAIGAIAFIGFANNIVEVLCNDCSWAIGWTIAIITAWVAVGFLFITVIIGGFLAFKRYSEN